MIIQIEGYHLYGRLTQTAKGVVVQLCRSDKPPGQRELMQETVLAPIAQVAENLRKILEQGAAEGYHG